MKPGLILLVCPAFLIVSCNAQSHRFAQPFRSRRINPIETTDATEESREDQNNANADNDFEVKRLIGLMKMGEGVNEPGTTKAVKHKSKKKKVPGSDRSVKQIRNGVGQARQEPVINGQHSVQKIRNRGKQIPTRISDSELGRGSRKTGVGEDKYTNTKKFRVKDKSQQKFSRKSVNTILSESGEHTYPTERIIIRVPKIEGENSSTEGFRKESSMHETLNESDKANSLSFLTTFLKSYEKSSATTTAIPKVTIPSKQDRDSLLSNMLNSNHKLTSDITKEINDINSVDDGDRDVKKLRKESERRSGIPIGSKANESKRLGDKKGQTGRGRGQRRPSSKQSEEETSEVKSTRTRGRGQRRPSYKQSEEQTSGVKATIKRGRGQERSGSRQSDEQTSELKSTSTRGRSQRRPSFKQSEEQTSEVPAPKIRRKGQKKPSSRQSEEQTAEVTAITTRRKGQRKPDSSRFKEQSSEVKSTTQRDRGHGSVSSDQIDEQTSEVKSTTTRGRGQRRPSTKQSSEQNSEVPAPTTRRKGQRKPDSRQSEEQTAEVTAITTRRKGQRKPDSRESEEQTSEVKSTTRGRGQRRPSSKQSEEQTSEEPAATTRRRGQKRPSSRQSAEQYSEVSEATKTNTHAPVFRSNKQTINNIYNIIEQAEQIQYDITRKSGEIISTKTEGLEISGKLDGQVTEKSTDKTATNSSLEIKPSNLFLSTFMGIQRTKRPQIAPSRINLIDKDENTKNLRVPQTEPQPKVEPKYPYSHRFSAGVAKHTSEPDISNEERPIHENVLDISKTRPVNHALPNTRSRNSLFSRKPFRPVGKSQKTEVDKIRSELEENETNNESNEIEVEQTEKVSEPSARFGLSARGRPKNHFQRPKNLVKEKTNSEVSSKFIHKLDESIRSNEEVNARFPIDKQEESSKSHLSAARFSIRGRGRPKTEEDNVKVEDTPASPPVFLPTQRPVPAQRKINYSEVVRHGQGRPLSTDIGDEVTNKKIVSSKGRHGVRGRGRPKGTARAKNGESHEDFENRTENFSLQSPLRARFSIPGSRKSRPSQTLPNITTKPIRFSPTSSSIKVTVENQDNQKSFHTNTEAFPTMDPIYSTTQQAPQLHRFGTDSSSWVGILQRPKQKEHTSIGSQPQTNARDSTIEQTEEETTKSSATTQSTPEIPQEEQIQVTTEANIIGRTRGSHVRKQEDDQSADFLKLNKKKQQIESKKDNQLLGRSKGPQLRKHEEVKSAHSPEKYRENKVRTETKLSGRLRGSLVRDQVEVESADFSKEDIRSQHTEVRTGNQHRGRSRGSLVRNQEDVKPTGFSQKDNESKENESTTGNHLRGRLRGSPVTKQEEVQTVDGEFEKQQRGRFEGSLVRNQEEVKSTIASQTNEDARRSYQRGRSHSNIKQVGKSEQNVKSSSNQRSRSRSRGRQNSLPKSVEKVQEVPTPKPFRPQVIEYQSQPLEEFTENEELQRTSVIPESREILFTEDDDIEKSLITFDPFTTSGPLETVLTYNFFPADTEHSKENFKVHVLDKPDIETVSEDLSDADLSDHLSSALNLATVTWTQDPYREEEEEAEGRPVFDIDFSKNPNHQ